MTHLIDPRLQACDDTKCPVCQNPFNIAWRQWNNTTTPNFNTSNDRWLCDPDPKLIDGNKP